MNALCMSIAADGTARCLWTDALPLAEIGRLAIQRASTVEFNGDTQRWEVRLMGSHEPDFTSPSRSACIEWEVNHLNHQLNR